MSRLGEKLVLQNVSSSSSELALGMVQFNLGNRDKPSKIKTGKEYRILFYPWYRISLQSPSDWSSEPGNYDSPYYGKRGLY